MRAADLAEQVEHFFRKTVGASADDESFNVRIGEHGFVFRAQLGNRRVGVGMILKIGQVFGARPFAGQQADLIFDIGGKFAGTVVGTERAASDSLETVTVGAGEAAVDGQLDGLLAELTFEPGTDGMIAQIAEWIFLWKCRIYHGFSLSFLLFSCYNILLIHHIAMLYSM